MRTLQQPALCVPVVCLMVLVGGTDLHGQKSQREPVLNFVAMGDPQPEEPPLEPPAVFKQILREVNALRPDCALLVGDVIRGFTDDTVQLRRMWDVFQQTVENVQVPLLLSVGNHDVWNEQSQQEYLRRFGRLYYSRDIGGVHFVVLNSYVLGSANKIAGEQLAWLRRDLERHGTARHIFVGVHAPLWAYGDQSNWMRDVHPLLKRYNVRAVFAGHWHIYQRSDIIDGVRYYIIGGAGGMQAEQSEATGEFPHYMYVTVRGDDVSYAVVKPGSVFEDTYVTKSSSAYAQNLRDNVVGDPRIEVHEGRLRTARIALSFRNPLQADLRCSVRWRLLLPLFVVDPPETTCSLRAGESLRLEFNVRSPAAVGEADLVRAHPVLDCTVQASDSTTPIAFSKELIVVRTAATQHYPQSLLVDGNLDEWSPTWPIVLDARSQVTLVPERWSGPQEVSGKFALALGDSTLCFAGMVVDSDVHHASRKEEPYQADAVSLYLDLRDSSEFQRRMFLNNVYLLVFVPQSDKGEPAYWQTVYPFGETLSGVTFGSRRVPGGYTVEVSVPLRVLKGLTPRRRELGLDVCIDNLASSGNRTRMLWNGIWANFMYANRYGRLILSDR